MAEMAISSGFFRRRRWPIFESAAFSTAMTAIRVSSRYRVIGRTCRATRTFLLIGLLVDGTGNVRVKGFAHDCVQPNPIVRHGFQNDGIAVTADADLITVKAKILR